MNIKEIPQEKLYEFSFIDYKGKKNTYTASGKNLIELHDFLKLEKRWSKEYRNNDPDSPRIPKIGDKVKLDTEAFHHPLALHKNGAIGTIIGYQKTNLGEYFIFQDNKNKDDKSYIKPYDIQWYY